MWQKEKQQVGSHMACAPFVNLVKWKIWKRSKRVCWRKITIINNLRNVYQTKVFQPWSASLKSFQVWVIEKSYNCIVHLHIVVSCCKNTAENFDGHVTDVVKIILDKNSISVRLSLLRLSWYQFELGVWSWLLASFRVRDRKCRSVGIIFRISEATLIVLRGQ